MSTADETAVPTPFESWQYVLRFLIALAASFGIISSALLGYGLYERGQANAAAPLLESQPSPDTLKEAFTQLRRPHFFAGWRVPDSILPEGDPVLGALDEEALARAAVALPKAAFDLPKVEKGKRPAGPETCKEDTACLVRALGLAVEGQTSPRHKLYRYLALRHAMAQGRALTNEELHFFLWNVTLWVRAFDREIMNGSGTPTASDAAMLSDLLDSRRGANENAIVFATYGFGVTALMGLTLLLWWRFRRPLG